MVSILKIHIFIDGSIKGTAWVVNRGLISIHFCINNTRRSDIVRYGNVVLNLFLISHTLVMSYRVVPRFPPNYPTSRNERGASIDQ